MEFRIIHELPGRVRLRTPARTFTKDEAPALCAVIEALRGVRKARASHLSGSILIYFDREQRDGILAAVSLMTRDSYDGIEMPSPGAPLAATLLRTAAVTVLRMTLLPVPLSRAVCVWHASSYVLRGLKALLLSRRLNVEVLDAAAISSAILRRDFTTAGVIMTLMALSEEMEAWTRHRSKEDLAQSLALRVDSVWVKRDGAEREIPFSELREGDMLTVRSGSVIPADGTVVEGEAVVNQSSMTGEPLGIVRRAGATVYAGTAVEEGGITIEVTAAGGATRIDKIIRVIEESEGRKAEVQSQAEKLADSIVPFNFALAAIVCFFTRSPERAASTIMVDYSCAIKIATPLAILSAMREGVRNGILIKGGKFIEAMACADTAVFDKTGTLTEAEPRVVKVVPFGGRSREDVLRLAACLEEHFPHPIARAVVRRAAEENLRHEEEHAEVEYIAAHGIASSLRGERTIIGSRHFVFNDENTACGGDRKAAEAAEAERHSLLYLAVGGEYAGIICIDDPLRQDAPAVISELKAEGLKHVVMLTGDGVRAARMTAAEAGITEVRAEMLPQDKAEYVRELSAGGRRAVMVGDGINDSPALSEASVGVTMKHGADIAQEVAGIVLLDERLDGLADARRICSRTMRKIKTNYIAIVGVNTLLILLGLTGRISPRASAILHNLTTLLACAYGLSPVMKHKSEK